MAFTDQDLKNSIDELAKLEDEIKRIDELNAKTEEAISANKGPLPDRNDPEVQKLMEEAKRKAEEEGRSRRAEYISRTGASEAPAAAPRARRGMMI